MTPLGDIIARQIRASGPITVADYMALCLGHPEHGYYITRDPLGRAGDFTTAPEISQMFGEMIGLWLASQWDADGRPDPFVLAELGPGRGTLMADALRAAGAVPGFTEAAEVWLVETSPVLRAAQADTLAAHAPHWADSIDALPDAPLYLVANEFFDALPIRVFRCETSGWAERMVHLDETGALAFGFAPPLPVGALDGVEADDGALIETAAPGEAIAEEVGARIAQSGGAALIIDYGDWDGTGDTLQALSGHAYTDPLAAPGEADLTAHVRFKPLAEAAEAGGAAMAGFTRQGVFLEHLGITERAQRLAATLSSEALEAHVAAHRRLLHPDEMGALFKTLALRPHGKPPVPGFPVS